ICISMESLATGLGLDQNGAGGAASIQSSVVGSEDLELLDSIHTGIDQKCRVSTTGSDVRIQHIIAFYVESVVFGAATVNAVLGAAHHAYLGFVLTCLVAHAGRKRDEGGKIAAVQSVGDDLLLRKGAGHFGILSLDLRDRLPFDGHVGRCLRKLHLYIEE